MGLLNWSFCFYYFYFPDIWRGSKRRRGRARIYEPGGRLCWQLEGGAAKVR